jgi:hypothetical protein
MRQPFVTFKLSSGIFPPYFAQSGVDVMNTIFHNFLRFFPIFGENEKNGVFLEHQRYDHIFAKFGFVLSQKRQFFR